MAFKMKGWSAFKQNENDPPKEEKKPWEDGREHAWTHPDHPHHEKMMKINVEKYDKKLGKSVDPKTGKEWVNPNKK